MKKIFLAIVLIVSSFSLVEAQSNALGLRLGWGAELSYQRMLQANRLEVDLGLDFGGGLNAAGVYQWMFDLSQLATGFNWYVGAGAYVGINNNFLVGAVGDLGIEYNFNIPLQLSLDWRPGLYFNTGANNVGFDWRGFALGIRYKF
ncbi:hypothetical protein D0T49_10560 [Paludibacter sp. 221]|uniref:hypothetical protein n=1 Tax=Paludibacter sp. 221 TaxID=2302939 RepID=UPI0013D0B1C6|nr:hypothetical protein [Paludibacter sp. 221]NDV47488.1 hypothetical protein [Paludibacter sp. 221]